ncbi:hypothetical protein [Methylobacterium sp. WL19]|uniref:hypothetical protein n=1 Tax=Methylobacterium sp. WL19 TaxID=2603896 RepID=UPI0011CB25AB|nr:hypothetical protein [Methylobacterium sp. WL19]TXN22077.1 hypothetical protein FV220_22390 [Methylobacterium sp. WL19]
MSDTLAGEIANLNEMAKHSYKKAFIRDLRGDQPGAAFWRGRARGLELAACNIAHLQSPPPAGLPLPGAGLGLAKDGD